MKPLRSGVLVLLFGPGAGLASAQPRGDTRAGSAHG